MANRRTKNKTKSSSTSLVIIVVAILLVIVVGLCVGIGAAVSTSDIGLIIDNRYVLSDVGGYVFEEGDEITVQRFEGTGELKISVYAVQSKARDFIFTADGTEWEWNSAIAGTYRDVTENFEFEVTQFKDDVGTIKYISGDEFGVIRDVAQTDDVKYVSANATGDMFALVVSVDDKSITIGFSLPTEPQYLDIKGNVVF